MRPYHYVNEFTGTKSAIAIEEPGKLFNIIKRAQRPLFVFGPFALNLRLNGRCVIGYGVDIAKALGCATVATGHVKAKLLEENLIPDSEWDIVEIINHLKDRNWKGVRGEGNHDLVIFLGIRPDLANQGLSTLKHFATHLKTLTLCFIYHPHATFSLPTMKFDAWKSLLEGLIEDLKKEFKPKEKVVEEKKEVWLFPVDVGPQYEGERIRKEDFYIEFGGGKNRFKGELLTIKPLDEICDERITIVGKDIKDFEEGSTAPLFIRIYVGGEDIEEDMEPVFERRLHIYCNYIEGFWHVGSRNENWIRLHKNSFKKGLFSFNQIGRILISMFKNELPLIKKMEIIFVTKPEKVEEEVEKAKEVYKVRDERASGLTDEEVDEFYGCTLCQSFAPTHVCIITPERPGLCGSVNWFDGRAAAKIDPHGAQFVVQKGEIIDQEKYIYSGVNEIVTKKSLGNSSVFCLHSALENPPTSCGCFQAICFYIPEVDGFGIVHRDFVGESVIGLRFSTMAGEVSGGRQIEGYVGISILYISSPKFLKTDGGLRRVVWMPKVIKEELKDILVKAEMDDKIATEEEVKDIDDLVAFLEEVQHPWLYGRE